MFPGDEAGCTFYTDASGGHRDIRVTPAAGGETKSIVQTRADERLPSSRPMTGGLPISPMRPVDSSCTLWGYPRRRHRVSFPVVARRSLRGRRMARSSITAPEGASCRSSFEPDPRLAPASGC